MKKNLKDSELYEQCYHLREKRSNAWFFIVIAVLLCFLLGFRYYWQTNFSGVLVDGRSMNQTLSHGDRLLMRLTDNGKEAKRGDVIVVYVGGYEECSSVGSENIIKRLIAIEGDKVQCIDGQVSIMYAGTEQYVPLDEPYAYYEKDKVFYDFEPYEVGEGEIFFLGDNRYNSMDSRYKQEGCSHLTDRLYKRADIVGIVPQWAIEDKEILGKLFFEIPEKIDRFFQKTKQWIKSHT